MMENRANGADFPVEVLSDIIVVLPLEEAKSEGGIVLPGQERIQREGKVVAAGPGRTYENGAFVPNPVQAGDNVVFGKYAAGGEPLWFRRQQYLLLRAGDIVGKLKPGEALGQIG
jgi:chaperonin GroES